MTDRTDPYEIIGVRRDASLAEIRISYRRSTQILAPERFANANDTVRAEAARRLTALNGAMEAIEAERAAESGSALGSLTFGGPAVSPAAEPSHRAVALVDDPPPPAGAGEATNDAVVDVEAPAEPAARKPIVIPPEAPVVEDAPPPADDAPPALDTASTAEEAATGDGHGAAATGELSAAAGEDDAVTGEVGGTTGEIDAPTGEIEAPTGDLPLIRDDDTQDGIPMDLGDTGEVPVVAEPAASLLETPNRPAVAAPAPATPRFERERPAKAPARTRSLLPRILGACALVAAAAAVAVYFLVGGSGSSTPPSGQFQRAGAPVSFTYPNGLVARKPPSGGLLRPTFATAVGVDAANYVVVATYHISANVQVDGSATGTGGSRLTADRFDESVDRAAANIAAAQKLRAQGLAKPGKTGDLIARVYDYSRPGGSSARYAFAFRGHTEYSIACFWDPAHAKTLSAACDEVMTSLQRESA